MGSSDPTCDPVEEVGQTGGARAGPGPGLGKGAGPELDAGSRRAGEPRRGSAVHRARRASESSAGSVGGSPRRVPPVLWRHCREAAGRGPEAGRGNGRPQRRRGSGDSQEELYWEAAELKDWELQALRTGNGAEKVEWPRGGGAEPLASPPPTAEGLERADAEGSLPVSLSRGASPELALPAAPSPNPPPEVRIQGSPKAAAEAGAGPGPGAGRGQDDQSKELPVRGKGVPARKRMEALRAMRRDFREHDLVDDTLNGGGVTDDLLCRFLRARSWDVPKASKLLDRYLKWRISFKPWAIRYADISLEFQTGKMYRLQERDLDGRSVAVFAPGNQNTKNWRAHMHQLVYTLEGATRSNWEDMDYPNYSEANPPPSVTPPEQKLTIVFDFSSYSLLNAPPVSQSLETLHILQDCYCERMGCALMINPPSIFSMMWKAISPFMDPHTRKKILFLRPAQGIAGAVERALSEKLDLDLLDQSLGGRADKPFLPGPYGVWMRSEEQQLYPWFADCSPAALSA